MMHYTTCYKYSKKKKINPVIKVKVIKVIKVSGENIFL